MGRIAIMKRQAMQEANKRNLGITEKDNKSSDNTSETNESTKNKNDETLKRIVLFVYLELSGSDFFDSH